MKKIPVGPTIRAAYSFVFTHLGAIIGLIWLPMILVTVAGFFVKQRYLAAAADAFASNDYASLGPAMLGLICYFVAALLMYAMMLVPVTQLALGLRKGGTLAHFALGPAEWRLFRGMIGLLAFLLLPIFIAMYLASALMSMGDQIAPLAREGLRLVFVLVCCGIVYTALRFLVLLPAIAASENGPVLPRAWILSGQNVGQMLLVVLATLVPVELFADLLVLALEGPRTLPNASVSTADVAALLHIVSLNMPIAAGVDFLVAPLVIGLAGGVSAAALSAIAGPAQEP